jgi:ethanolamine utilization microcompartment shell protein EutL
LLRFDTDGLRAVSADVGGAGQAFKDAGSALRALGGAADSRVQAGLDVLTRLFAGALDVLGDDAMATSSQKIAGGADAYDATDQALANGSAPPSTGGVDAL